MRLSLSLSLSLTFLFEEKMKLGVEEVHSQLLESQEKRCWHCYFNARRR